SHERTRTDDDRVKNIRALQRRLREEVAEGWYFARRFGHEAIIRDSIDYQSLVEKYDDEARKSARRIQSWRRFIDDYLDFRKAATLVVLLDDSDVEPELAQDILHSIRMFLNHPRVVIVLAGNIRAMRNSLLHVAMRRLSQSTHALLVQSKSRTAQDWRRA